MKSTQNIKVPGYITYQANSTDEPYDRCHTHRQISNRLDDDYITSFLDIKINIDIGDINIATT